MSRHLVEEAAGGLFPHFFSGIVDGGELWVDDLGDDIVVKTYDGYIFRYATASFFQRLLKYGRAKIIRNKNAIGSGGHAEQLFCCLKGMCFAEITYEHESRVVGQPVVCQGLLVAFQTAGIYISCEVCR